MAAVVADGIGLYLQLVQDASVPWWFYLVVSLVGLTVAQFLAFHKLRQDLMQYREQPQFTWSSRIFRENSTGNHYALIGVRHVRGKTAEACKVRVTQLLHAATGATPTGFNPETVKWRGHKGEELEVEIDIHPNEEREATAFASPINKPLPDATLVKTTSTPGLRVTSSSNAVPTTILDYPPGEYLVCMGLSGRNLWKPELQWFTVSVSDEPSTLDIQIAEPPLRTSSSNGSGSADSSRSSVSRKSHGR